MRQNNKQRIWISLLIGLLGYWVISVFPAKASAADVSLGVYPPIVQINANAPSDITSPLKIINLSDNPVTLGITLRPFRQSSSQTGLIELLPDKSQPQGDDPQIFNKIQIIDPEDTTDSPQGTPVTELTLSPKQQKDLMLHITLPKDEPPSDYYFSIVYMSKDIGNDQSNFSSLIGGITTNVLLSIGPQDKTTGSIDEFSAPFFFEHGPVPFTVKINNSSRHFITPQGTIILTDMFGKQIGRVDLLPVNILEDSSRFIPSTVNDDTHAIWPETFLLGLYKAHLTVALSQNGPIYNRTIYFFAFPFSLLLGILLGLIIVTIIIIRVKKRIQ